MNDVRVPEYIVTYSGKRFNLRDPKPDQIDIQDIALALSNICRFTGHVRPRYSVAEHCVRVSWLCPTEHKLWGLLHDAEEAYFNDVSKPLKSMRGMENYEDLANHAREIIIMMHGLEADEPAVVRHCDRTLYNTECRDLTRIDWLYPDVKALEWKIVPWDQFKAEHMYLAEYYRLTNQPEKFILHASAGAAL